MNAPERSSAFLLDEDAAEVKCVYTADTKVRLSSVVLFDSKRCYIMVILHHRHPDSRLIIFFHLYFKGH